jgi:hypothetical protein
MTGETGRRGVRLQLSIVKEQPGAAAAQQPVQRIIIREVLERRPPITAQGLFRESGERAVRAIDVAEHFRGGFVVQRGACGGKPHADASDEPRQDVADHGGIGLPHVAIAFCGGEGRQRCHEVPHVTGERGLVFKLPHDLLDRLGKFRQQQCLDEDGQLRQRGTMLRPIDRAARRRFGNGVTPRSVLDECNLQLGIPR